MARYPNLWRRGSRYYLRIRVPADLRRSLKKEHHTESLQTSDHRQAVSRYRLAQARVCREFDERRAALAERDATTIALNEGRLHDLTQAQLQGLVARWWEARAASRRPDVPEGQENEMLILMEEDASHLRETGAAQGLIDQLLIAAGAPVRRRRIGGPILSINRDCEQFSFLERLIVKALNAENRIARDHILRPSNNPAQEDLRSVLDMQGGGRASTSVAELIGRYRDYRMAEHGSESTNRKYAHIFKALEEALGPHTPAEQISADDCRAVRSLLQRAPSNSTKRFPKLSLQEAAAAAEGTDLPRLSPTTINSYMNNLSAILNWALERKIISHNAAKGLALRKGRPQTRRRGFSEDELSTIFAALAPLRTSHPERFWVPAMALYTGARAGELCQLRVGDVIEIEGVSCLDLSEFDEAGRRVEGKSLKTAPSERVLPVHAELIEAGFLSFAAAQRNRGALELFPLLCASKRSPSHEFSKWFGRFLDRLKLNEPTLVFHSFRHGFRDACRNSGISAETADALGGWAAANQGQRYGNRGSVRIFSGALARLSYGAFRLPRP